MSKRNRWKLILGGVLLILLAAYIITNRMGLLPEFDFPIFKIVISAILLFITVDGCVRLNFFLMLMPLAGIACLFSKELHIEAITPWILLGATALVSLGATLIKRSIRGSQKKIYYSDGSAHVDDDVVIDSQNAGAQGTTFNSSNIVINGSMGDHTQYISSDNFESCQINGSMGDITLYFMGATMAHNEATLSVKGSMGNINVYIPSAWRADTRFVSGLGDIKVQGQPSNDPEAPLLRIEVVGGLGDVRIFFE